MSTIVVPKDTNRFGVIISDETRRTSVAHLDHVDVLTLLSEQGILWEGEDGSPWEVWEVIGEWHTFTADGGTVGDVNLFATNSYLFAWQEFAWFPGQDKPVKSFAICLDNAYTRVNGRRFVLPANVKVVKF